MNQKQSVRSETFSQFCLVLIAGIGTMVVSVHDSFQAKDYRVFWASLFASLGLTGIVPVIHGWIVNYDIAAVHSALSLDVLMGVIYLVSMPPASSSHPPPPELS